MTVFGRFTESGEFAHVRTINQSDLAACPHFILMAEHYRADGTCRCDDPDHREMADWGYVWGAGVWYAPEDDDA